MSNSNNPYPRPLPGFIVVVKEAKTDVTKGGIILPEGSSEPKKAYQAEVVRISSETVDIAVGEHIIAPWMAGSTLETEEGLPYTIVRESDVLGVID